MLRDVLASAQSIPARKKKEIYDRFVELDLPEAVRIIYELPRHQFSDFFNATKERNLIYERAYRSPPEPPLSDREKSVLVFYALGKMLMYRHFGGYE